MSYLLQGKTKLTGDTKMIKTLADFESAIAEAKEAGQPYSIKHSQGGCSYRALARKIGDGLKHGRWDYEDKAVADIDAMIAAYGKETVHSWAMNEFLTDGDDQATRGESKGRIGAVKAGKVAAIVSMYAKILPALGEDRAVEYILQIASESGVSKEVATALKLDTI
jgi:hypothetical protein